jgi:DNA-directed RNA polymerase specialized sigma24 family protein
MNLDMDQSIIRQLVQDMGKPCGQLLAYFYFDGFSTKVIAEKLGYANADTVKSKKYQCFKKLQGTVLATYHKEELL